MLDRGHKRGVSCDSIVVVIICLNYNFLNVVVNVWCSIFIYTTKFSLVCRPVYCNIHVFPYVLCATETVLNKANLQDM